MKAYPKYWLVGLFLTCITVYVSCGSRGNRGVWVVEDITRDTLLIAETRIKNSNRLILEVTGVADDSIKVFDVIIPGGVLQDTISGDWYHSTITVQYEAYKATQGRVEIKYYLPGFRYF